MSAPLDLNDPIAVLLAVSKALRTAGIGNAAYGGLALAVYGEPRETKDADLAVAGVGGEQGAAALRAAGLEVMLAFDRVRFGGNWITRLTLVGGGALNMADLVEPASPRFARAVLGRAIEGTLRGDPIRVVTPEDFVMLKVLSTRERDLEDAAALLRSPAVRIDHAALEQEASSLAAELGDHDVTGRWRRAQELARGRV